MEISSYKYRPSLENRSHQLLAYRGVDRYCIYVASQSADVNAFSRDGRFFKHKQTNRQTDK